VALVGDRDRERTAGALQRHYVEGRVSSDELAERLDRVLRARTRLDLLLATRSLPGHSPLRELLEPPARAAASVVGRAVLLVLLTAVWVATTVVFFLGYAIVALADAASTETLIGFSLVWALVTWLLWRAWRRGARPA
jgi:hypothetical protein